MSRLSDRYRPLYLDDVVGQEPVVKVLKDFVTRGEIPSALMFSGPPGTGKTSTSRAFERALNCESPRDADACGLCKWCLVRSREIGLLLEYDAANFGSVEVMRQIRDHTRLVIGYSKARVFLLDEFQGRASPQAETALLKLLEENPSGNCFILATTEPGRLMSTTRSRTMELAFSPIGEGDVLQRLRHIASVEKLSIDEGTLNAIASGSGGNLRNAVIDLEKTSILGAYEGSVRRPDPSAVVVAALDSDVAAFIKAVSDYSRVSPTVAEAARLFRLIEEDLANLAAGKPATTIPSLPGEHHVMQVRAINQELLIPLRLAVRRLDRELGGDGGAATGVLAGMLYAALNANGAGT